MKNMNVMEKGKKKESTASVKKVVNKPAELKKTVEDDAKTASVAILQSVKAEKASIAEEKELIAQKKAAIAEEKATEDKIIKMEKAVEASKKAKKETTKKATQEATKTTVRKTGVKVNDGKEEKMNKEEIFIQFTNKEISMDVVMDRVKDAYVAEGNLLSSADDICVYIKPEENMIYYVVNNSYASGISLY